MDLQNKEDKRRGSTGHGLMTIDQRAVKDDFWRYLPRGGGGEEEGEEGRVGEVVVGEEEGGVGVGGGGGGGEEVQQWPPLLLHLHLPAFSLEEEYV